MVDWFLGFFFFNFFLLLGLGIGFCLGSKKEMLFNFFEKIFASTY